ncbi:hypothetical protein MPL1032_180120 [Mesorhizobium plurifarium]|uniref:Uncharacterized protein n=1 Tax=Mesorhizobium plurifarium TaxID=69974 RepID=A0A0K2VUA5_MESPL|nr:hypothetical protein MPL1032_180120 [Mesorhizobium plurifarium]
MTCQQTLPGPRALRLVLDLTETCHKAERKAVKQLLGTGPSRGAIQPTTTHGSSLAKRCVSVMHCNRSLPRNSQRLCNAKSK